MPLSPGQTTLGTVRDTVRQRADMVGSQFVTDAELNGYIQASYFELYDLLVTAYGENYYQSAAPYSFQTDGTNERFALPSDFYKALGVEVVVGQAPQGCVTMQPFTFAERNQYALPGFPVVYGILVPKYRIAGNTLWLVPRPPPANLTIRVDYVPRPSSLTSDSDIIDGVSGWEDYVVVDAAIKALEKEESDVSVFMAQKQALLKRIQAAAENRDAGSPATVADVYAANGAGGFGWGV